MFTENWDKLTPDQRYEERMKAWFAIEADIPFVSDEVREAWRERVQMLRDAIELRKPKRVPVFPMGGFFAAQYSGLTARELYYDYPKAQDAYLKVNADFDFDGAFSTFAGVFPAEMYDILDLKLVSWPGHGTDDDCPLPVQREGVDEGRRVRSALARPLGLLAARLPAAYLRCV